MEKEIIITVEVPTECTANEFAEWVEFCLGYRGNISLDNPLCLYDLEAKDIIF